jgi:hypothetical protein
MKKMEEKKEGGGGRRRRRRIELNWRRTEKRFAKLIRILQYFFEIHSIYNFLNFRWLLLSLGGTKEERMMDLFKNVEL